MSAISSSVGTKAEPHATQAALRGLLFYSMAAFGFTWSILVLAILAVRGVISLPLSSVALVSMATLGPTLAAISVTVRESGSAGVRALLGQVLRWRVHPVWYAIALIGPALIMLVAFLLWRVLGGPLLPASSLSTWLSLPILIAALLVPALFEEVGWRGYALPRLRRRYSLLAASMIVGVIHASWHLPLWLIPGLGFDGLPFPVYSMLVLGMAILLGWLYNSTGGSLLIVGLFHAAINAFPSPWGTVLQSLPEGERGLNIQIPVALTVCAFAILVALLTDPRSAKLKRSARRIFLLTRRRIHVLSQDRSRRDDRLAGSNPGNYQKGNQMTTQTQSSHDKRGLRWWAGRILMGGLVLVLVLGTSTRIAGTLAKSNLTKQYPAPGQLVDVGGYKMHINCVGQGSPTVVLAVGLDDFSIPWAFVQPEVAKFTRVCSYDRAGLGWSEPSPNLRTSRTMVEELHTLLVNAPVEKPYVLVGHSFGGALVRLYAHDYPDQVTGMVLVDATHDELITRIPAWRKALNQKLGLFRTLAPLSSFGLLALSPENIPNRGLPDKALAQYRAIAVTTKYFETGIAENEAFDKNLAEVRAAHITGFGNMPLFVLSRGYWEPMPGLFEGENQQAWYAWQAMQSELVSLSSKSMQLIAEKSGHDIHLQEPELVIDAIRQIVEMARDVPSHSELW